jgi:hypothetical protein
MTEKRVDDEMLEFEDLLFFDASVAEFLLQLVNLLGLVVVF